MYGSSPALLFVGGDERLGAYFEDPDLPESQRAYAMLTIRASAEFGAACAGAAEAAPTPQARAQALFFD